MSLHDDDNLIVFPPMADDNSYTLIYSSTLYQYIGKPGTTLNESAWRKSVSNVNNVLGSTTVQSYRQLVAYTVCTVYVYISMTSEVITTIL